MNPQPSLQAEHPVVLRGRQRAADMSSTAVTLGGIVRFLRQHWTYGAHRFQPQSPQEWLESVKRRRQHPDASRARDDHRFRRGYLARLRREEKNLLVQERTAIGVWEYARSMETRQSRLKAIASLRKLVAGRAAPAKTMPPPKGLLITVGLADIPPHCRSRCVDAQYAAGFQYQLSQTDGWTEWKNRVPRRYHRGTYELTVVSFAVILDDHCCEFAWQVEDRCPNDPPFITTLTLSDGYKWQGDHLGLSVVRLSDGADYHPTASELRARGAVAKILEALDANAKRRAKAKAQMAAEKAETEGVWVCLADSLSAGNCKAGTLTFARKHALDPSRHYRACELLDCGEHDTGRVRLAISAARIRHRRELQQGYSMLRDHGFDLKGGVEEQHQESPPVCSPDSRQQNRVMEAQA